MSLLQKQPSATIGCKSPALLLRREIVLNPAVAGPHLRLFRFLILAQNFFVRSRNEVISARGSYVWVSFCPDRLFKWVSSLIGLV
jgi:hypothetical protein